jgi:hypothetical protein
VGDARRVVGEGAAQVVDGWQVPPPTWAERDPALTAGLT